MKANVTRKCCLITVGLVISIFTTIAVLKLIGNRIRVSAFNHLSRNAGLQAELNTWTVKPKAVLQSFPQSRTVLGTIQYKPRFIREIVHTVSVELIVARLSGPDANDTDLRALAHFPELEYLELVNTNVTESALEKFREALPECQIVHN